MKIALETRSSNTPGIEKLYRAFDVSEKGDICIALGGDGTVLRASAKYDMPILPIRDGAPRSVGYYSDVSVDDMDFIIENLKRGNYKVETLENKLQASYAGKNYYAVNDVTLVSELGKEVSLNIKQIRNGKAEELYPFEIPGDGVIMCVKVGSTAYNKSAGGPILLTADAWCITLSNPDTVFKNSLVLGRSDEVNVEVVKYAGHLNYDGIEISKVVEGDKVRVKLSDKELKVVKFEGREESFSEKLRRIIRMKTA